MSIEGVFSPQEVRTIKVWMEKKFWVRSFIPSFRGKYKLALFFFWLGKVFQLAYNAWDTSDEKLGEPLILRHSLYRFLTFFMNFYIILR